MKSSRINHQLTPQQKRAFCETPGYIRVRNEGGKKIALWASCGYRRRDRRVSTSGWGRHLPDGIPPFNQILCKIGFIYLFTVFFIGQPRHPRSGLRKEGKTIFFSASYGFQKGDPVSTPGSDRASTRRYSHCLAQPAPGELAP